MTWDITIGKISIASCQSTDGKNTILVCQPRLIVEKCPSLDYDLCDKEYTLWTKESYRSGSYAFKDFWETHINKLYKKFKPNYPDSNGVEISYLKPFINEINKLPDILNKPVDKDRMLWFKFWSNKAVELYNDLAGIMFA